MWCGCRHVTRALGSPSVHQNNPARAQSFGEVGKHLGEEWRAITDKNKARAST